MLTPAWLNSWSYIHLPPWYFTLKFGAWSPWKTTTSASLFSMPRRLRSASKQPWADLSEKIQNCHEGFFLAILMLVFGRYFKESYHVITHLHPITIYTCMHLVCLILHPTRNIFPNTSKTWKLPWCFQNRLAIKMPCVLSWSLEVAFMGCTHPKTNIAPKKWCFVLGQVIYIPLKSWNLDEGQGPLVCTSLKWTQDPSNQLMVSCLSQTTNPIHQWTIGATKKMIWKIND